MLAAGQTDSRARKRIGKYAIVGRIGRGGMGMVYRGWDELLEREVAVKTLTAEGIGDEESRKRFLIEARASARLQHPNIVTVFELGEDRGLPFIAMELLGGTDMDSLLRSGEALLLQEKLDLLIQVCRGLAYAHEHGIVHRDIKPTNVRVLEDGTAKIMDFGIAKLAGTGVTKTGMMVGTVHYMSPEQIRGKPLDGRSDVFSLGVILHEVLVGQRPFKGETATDVLYRIVQDAHPTIDVGAFGEVGAELQAIVDRALAKEVEQRYPRATDMADELSRALSRHLRSLPGGTGAEAVEQVGASRRLLKDGRIDECLRSLEELREKEPHSLEVRRALRAATREMQRRSVPRVPEPDDFPELEVTYHTPATMRARETMLHDRPGRAPGTTAPTQHLAPETQALPTEAERGGRSLIGVAAAVVALALAAGVYLATRPDTPAEPAKRDVPPATSVRADVAPPVTVAPGPAAAAPASIAITVESDPAGASLSLDGKPVAGATPVEVSVDPAVEHRLTVSLDGHRTQELTVAAGQTASLLKVKLESSGPLGRLSVSAPYPVDVLWKGKTLVRGQTSAQVNVPAGKQTVSLVSGQYFLRTSHTVDVKADGSSSVSAPALGRIHIRANPDNCRVFIDGAFVDYPPILDRPIAVGRHTVSFQWPEGGRTEEPVDVSAGSPSYVTGRRD